MALHNADDKLDAVDLLRATVEEEKLFFFGRRKLKICEEIKVVVV